MAGATTTSLAIAIVALIVVVLLTLPGATKLYYRWSANKKQYQEFTDKYEDEDGVATEESEAAFSTKIQCVLILLFALIGFAVSLVSSVLATLREDARLPVESWLQFAAWVRIQVTR